MSDQRREHERSRDSFRTLQPEMLGQAVLKLCRPCSALPAMDWKPEPAGKKEIRG